MHQKCAMLWSFRETLLFHEQGSHLYLLLWFCESYHERRLLSSV
jgi:hypothetical protein